MRQILFILSLFIIYHTSNAQGCVAIRSNGSTCTMMCFHESHQNTSDWTFAINSRYFKSYKHFVGTEEQKERVENGTEVINHFFSTEFGINRQINDRWSFAFYAPLISNARSSMYEHYGNTSKSPNARRSTHSFGLGDVRLAAYYWLLNPAQATKANVQLGLGIKLPTGDYRYQDYLYNPREQNGVSTARGGATSATAVIYGSDVMSVPDQYMLRLGANYNTGNLSFSGGMRMECVPAEDLIGGSNGFRRPGYVLAAEPVVALKLQRAQLYVSVPFAVERNRTQSVPDKLRTEKTGVYAHGDAAFADYSINFGIAFSLK